MHAQTFGKLYRTADALRFFDACQTSDGGFAAAGLRDDGLTQTLCLVKLDCEGLFVWAKEHTPSSSVDHIRMRVIQKKTGEIVLMGNLGSYSNYNILVAVYDLDGNLQWGKTLGGSRDDNGNGITETQDGGLVISGYTSSFGSDVTGTTTIADQYIIKLSSSGTILWSTTAGNVGAVDRAYEIVELQDKGFIISGSYLTNGNFFASLCRLDSNGTVLWLKSYGKLNHSTHGYTVCASADGGFILGGSSTALKTNYQDYPDNLLIKTDANGDTLWVKIYHGTNPDLFEDFASVIEAPNGNIFSLSATSSYPSTGFVPNKYVLIETDSSGIFQGASQYNGGGSHYPRVRKALFGGYLIAGFSNWTGYGLNGNTWNALLFKTDANFEPGCKKQNLSTPTIEQRPGFEVYDPPRSIGTGCSEFTALGSASFSATDSTFCQNFPPPPFALFSADTNAGCAPLDINFLNQSSGTLGKFEWDFGDGQSSNVPSPTHTYSDSGTYTVSLMAIDTICKDTSVWTNIIYVWDQPLAVFSFSPVSPVNAGQLVQFTDQSQGNIYDWAWAMGTGDSLFNKNPAYVFVEPGTYQVSLRVLDLGGCAHDTVQEIVVIIDTVIPNIFTPNGDGLNEELKIIGLQSYQIIIFDRWGNQIFDNAEVIDNYWNGKNRKGEDCPEGVYYYILDGKDYFGSEFHCALHITLLR